MDTTSSTASKVTMADHFAAARQNGYPNWNPVTHPWRVSYTYHGQFTRNMSETAVFASEVDARAAFNASMPGRALYAEIHLAINPESWPNGSRWHRVDKRARRRAKPAAKAA